MGLQIEFQGSEIDRVDITGTTVTLHFRALTVIDVQDKFGFDFKDVPPKTGKIILKNAEADKWPKKGEVFDGAICIGALTYIGGCPIDTHIRETCYLRLDQKTGMTMIFAEDLEVVVKTS